MLGHAVLPIFPEGQCVRPLFRLRPSCACCVRARRTLTHSPSPFQQGDRGRRAQLACVLRSAFVLPFRGERGQHQGPLSLSALTSSLGLLLPIIRVSCRDVGDGVARYSTWATRHRLRSTCAWSPPSTRRIAPLPTSSPSTSPRTKPPQRSRFVFPLGQACIALRWAAPMGSPVDRGHNRRCGP